MRFRLKLSVVIAGLILLGSNYYFFGIFLPGLRPTLVARNLAGGYGYGNDLYPVWMASRELCQGRTPYAPELTPKIEVGLYGRPLDRSKQPDAQVNYRAFSYPLYTVFLLGPLAALSFPTVQIVVCVLLPILAAATTILWSRTLMANPSTSELISTVCLTLASYPVLEGIYAGQPGLISAALIAGSIAALVKEQFVLAGILLPLASIKPQLIVLISLWLILWALASWSERRNFISAFAVTTGALLVISTWVLPNWLAEWMHALREYRQISPPPLAQFVLGRAGGDILALFLLVLCVWICRSKIIQPARSDGFALATCFVLATTTIVFPSTIAIYDQFLLLPGVLFLYTRSERILRASVPVRMLTLLAAGALGWQWIAACGVALARWYSPQLVHGSGALLLPMRTAASVPFAFTALLCYLAIHELRGARQYPSRHSA